MWLVSQAFVHDPLINWRLFNFNEVPQMSLLGNSHGTSAVNAEEPPEDNLQQPQRGARERELLQVPVRLSNINEQEGWIRNFIRLTIF